MVRLLKHLDCRAKVVCLARHPFQAEAALAGGADVALTSPKRKELALAVGGKFIASTLGGGNIEGGADLVFDCVGGSRSLEDGLLCLRAAGRYVMVGTASVIAKADVSSLWFRELRITGSSGFSSALYQGKRVRTYQLAMDILASGLYPVKGLLTHTFALSEYRAAFQVAFDKSSHKSLKVAFDLRKQPAKACPPEPPTQGE